MIKAPSYTPEALVVIFFLLLQTDAKRLYRSLLKLPLHPHGHPSAAERRMAVQGRCFYLRKPGMSDNSIIPGGAGGDSVSK